MRRLPIIRHVRYFWHKYQVLRHYDAWASLGMHAGNMKYDIAVLDEIWAGRL